MSTPMASTEGAPRKMNALAALGMVLGIVVVIGVFLYLCHLLAITEYWAGFLFILYWGMIDKVENHRLPATIIGGVVGLLIGYSTPMLAGVLGEASGLVFLAMVLVMLFVMLMGWLKMAINAMTMVFLTVATIPAVAEHTDPLNALFGFVFGIVFFAGFICTGKAIKARKGDV